jgi:hypothetical protein
MFGDTTSTAYLFCGHSGSGFSPQAVAGSPDYWKNGVLQSLATRDGLYTAFTSANSLAGIVNTDLSGFDSLKLAGYYNIVSYPAYNFQGHIGEMVAVVGTSTTGRQLIEGYLAWKWGLEANLPADHPYKSSAPLTNPRNFCTQVYDLVPWIITNYNEQVYNLPYWIVSYNSQVYGLKLTTALSQPYGDTPVVASYVTQYYGDAYQPKNSVNQVYGDAQVVSALVEQLYSLAAYHTGQCAQPYAISGTEVKNYTDQVYDISGVSKASSSCSQPYALLGETGGTGETLVIALTVTVDGVVVDPISVQIVGTQDQYCLSCTIELATQEDFLICSPQATIDIVLNGTLYVFFVEGRQRNRSVGEASYTVTGLSKTALLDAPYADTVSDEQTGMASVIVTMLASGYTVDWRTIDWFIPPNTLLPADETPLSIIRTIAAAAGAIIQTSPAGVLIIQPKYPVKVPDWDVVIPVNTFSDVDDFFTASDQYEHRDGFNKFLISDQLSSQDTLRLETESISDTQQYIRGYKTPWDETYTLRHTGGTWVVLEYLGIEETEKIEVVEFVAGAGRTQYPIYDIIDLEWLQTNLGTVTHGEDGYLESVVEAESLLSITYKTKCRKWKATDPNIEKVQFVAEES